MKTTMRKLKRRAGFTLAETLITILILSMVSLLMAEGIPAAMNAYYRAVDAANAHVVLSTAVMALRDELCTAWDVEVLEKADAADTDKWEAAYGDAAWVLRYTSSDTGHQAGIFLGRLDTSDENSPIVIKVQEYDDYGGEAMNWKPPAHPLVSKTMTKLTWNRNKNMEVTIEPAATEPTISDGILTIKNLKIIKDSTQGDSPMAEMPENGLQIRVLTAGGETP